MSELSHVERIKRESRLLRGTLVESLADPLTGAIREDDTALIKFHGSYSRMIATSARSGATRSSSPPTAS